MTKMRMHKQPPMPRSHSASASRAPANRANSDHVQIEQTFVKPTQTSSAPSSSNRPLSIFSTSSRASPASGTIMTPSPPSESGAETLSSVARQQITSWPPSITSPPSRSSAASASISPSSASLAPSPKTSLLFNRCACSTTTCVPQSPPSLSPAPSRKHRRRALISPSNSHTNRHGSSIETCAQARSSRCRPLQAPARPAPSLLTPTVGQTSASSTSPSTRPPQKMLVAVPGPRTVPHHAFGRFCQVVRAAGQDIGDLRARDVVRLLGDSLPAGQLAKTQAMATQTDAITASPPPPSPPTCSPPSNASSTRTTPPSSPTVTCLQRWPPTRSQDSRRRQMCTGALGSHPSRCAGSVRKVGPMSTRRLRQAPPAPSAPPLGKLLQGIRRPPARRSTGPVRRPGLDPASCAEALRHPHRRRRLSEDLRLPRRHSKGLQRASPSILGAL